MRLTLTLIALVVLVSCKVGPNYEPATATTMDTYRFTEEVSSDTVLNLKWWELFADDDLDTLIKVALEENRNIQIALNNVEQAATAIGIAKADYWPQIGYSGGYAAGNVFNGVPSGADATGVLTGFGTLSWELDFWGKLRRATESAQAQMLASQYGTRALQVNIISQVVGTYYLLLDYKWRLDISKNTAELRQESLDIIQARFDMGIVPQIDVNQAEIQLAIAAAAVPIFERKVAQTENALSILIGRNPASIISNTPLIEQTLPPDIPTGLPSVILTRRPDIQQAQAVIQAQNAQVGVATAQRFPTISLTAMLGIASTDLSALTANGLAWNAGGAIAGPILNYGKNKRRVEIEKLKTEQLILEYEQTVLTSFREVEDALVEISTLKKELEKRRDHVDAALNARNLSKERYDKGVTSFLELLESQRQAFEAELNLSQARQELFNAYTKLYKALGGGWLSAEEEQNANNQ